MSDPLKPSMSLLVKLASALVHVDEARSAHGHHLDWVAYNSAVRDPEVVAWMQQMQAMSLLPEKRR